MRRLIWGFAGRTYHIVGNLMHWLIYVCHSYTVMYISWNIVVTCRERADLLVFLYVIIPCVFLPFSVLGQVWYLILSIPDRCLLHYFEKYAVCLFCCFTSQVNSYGHGATVSSPNLTIFFSGQAWTSSYQYFVNILSLVTDNNPSCMIQMKGGEWP